MSLAKRFSSTVSPESPSPQDSLGLCQYSISERIAIAFMSGLPFSVWIDPYQEWGIMLPVKLIPYSASTDAIPDFLIVFISMTFLPAAYEENLPG